MKTAFALFVLCFDLALVPFAAARTPRGVINDPDGYTNLRAEPRENAAIIARVKGGEVFNYNGRERETWWKVTLSSGKSGWMHCSRIRMFVVPEDLVVAENDEANTWARAHGVDYLRAIRGTAKGDKAAMQQFFGVGCDGAACDTHIEIMIKLIHVLGDEKLAKFLSPQSTSFRKEVAEDVTTDLGLPPFEPIDYMKRNFPKTAKLLFPR